MEKQSEGLVKLSDPIAIIYFDESTIFSKRLVRLCSTRFLVNVVLRGEGESELFDSGVVLLCIQATPLYLILPLL